MELSNLLESRPLSIREAFILMSSWESLTLGLI
jgi:hypothetical protein